MHISDRQTHILILAKQREIPSALARDSGWIWGYNRCYHSHFFIVLHNNYQGWKSKRQKSKRENDRATTPLIQHSPIIHNPSYSATAHLSPLSQPTFEGSYSVNAIQSPRDIRRVGSDQKGGRSVSTS